ncbi:maleylpyruvate isomerase family mycothiol-dependent enzyme [Pseudonocardia humida]|uniref:Maleylpyruvate isomerase family mycothiol-dependent enzyme n=1 Tax=Pseudonocardia humida TaxID=2800819 RepID=A0ABT1A4M6_9PSEU|nr:maleylpyruvate isomerase family mycothiol-dependent enzyme [Pseudonocardia humida]MCO1657962.1 maleylpyruvate isomerase family mycothiol-dependent enzyme [Pseudonocardia humida]
MRDDEILDWTRTERLGLADFLDGLDDDQWRAPSLCAGWSVHDLAAHLTLSTRTTLGLVIKEAIRARGSFDRMELVISRERAARFDRHELVAQLRETAGSPRRAPGAGPLDPLVDALVHGQDLARALGMERPMPPAPAVAALEHVRTSGFYGGRRRFRGTRLVATDVDWSAGAGPEEIRGPVADLLLVATGRTAGLAALSGPGTRRLVLA